MPLGSDARDEYFDELDQPKHALEYGGVTGHATIRGIPTGSSGRPGEGNSRNRRIGVVMEPVPVLMRDAVTIDTAVRLTGISRLTLQRAAYKGNLPVLKTGPDHAPYLVRLRDVITYLVTMYTERRARKELTGGEDTYMGFPEWLVREVSESWPGTRAFTPGHWSAKPVRVNRGGRPRGVKSTDPNNPGYSAAGVKLGRPPGKRGPRHDPLPPKSGEILFPEKATPPEGNHPQAATAQVPVDATGSVDLSKIDRSRLPKWHPLWQRPDQ